jgi:predicted  nucleic acid-binding Zn-ribbon protein
LYVRAHAFFSCCNTPLQESDNEMAELRQQVAHLQRENQELHSSLEVAAQKQQEQAELLSEFTQVAQQQKAALKVEIPSSFSTSSVHACLAASFNLIVLDLAVFQYV